LIHFYKRRWTSFGVSLPFSSWCRGGNAAREDEQMWLGGAGREKTFNTVPTKHQGKVE